MRNRKLQLRAIAHRCTVGNNITKINVEQKTGKMSVDENDRKLFVKDNSGSISDE